MKKMILGAMAAVMAVSLAACTPTPEKQADNNTTEATVVAQTGGAADKVPDPNVEPVEIISVYHKSDDGAGLVKDMDAIDTKDAQLLVDKLIEYGVLGADTKVLEYKEEGKTGTLNLSACESAEGASDKVLLAELGNTFLENFQLDQLKLLVNGENYSGSDITQADDDHLTYESKFKDLE